MSQEQNRDAQIVEYATHVSVVLEKAAALERADAHRKAAVAALVPEVVDALVGGGHVKPGAGEKVAGMLADHATALEFLREIATNNPSVAVASLGQPDGPTKSASVEDEALSPFVGLRTSKPRKSDELFLRGLGLSTNGANLG